MCRARLVMLLLLLWVCPVQAAEVSEFTDLQDHWAREEILLLMEQGVSQGYPDRSYRPEQGLTRAEFVSQVNRCFDLVPPDTINPEDYGIDPEVWYARDLALAVQAGYIKGYEDGSLRPHAMINRQETAVILARLFEVDLSNADMSVLLSDETIPDWSRASIAALIADGYLNGYNDGTFRPGQVITRAEVSVVLAKKVKREGKTAPAMAVLPAGQLEAQPANNHDHHSSSHRHAVNRAQLIQTIQSAQSSLSQAEQGNAIGQYPPSAVQGLKDALEEANAINQQANQQDTIDQAVLALLQSKEWFENQRILTGVSNVLRGEFKVES
ncbi:MAG: S-layer homology domain-containing protein [Bacillota bacterium]|nr:S-layer homology domain-containing protein [Bacillota bacterium]